MFTTHPNLNPLKYGSAFLTLIDYVLLKVTIFIFEINLMAISLLTSSLFSLALISLCVCVSLCLPLTAIT